jgi:hypothetical protein
MTVAALTFREGRAGDLGSVFELGEIAWDESRRARGLLDEVRSGEQLREDWLHDRPMLEFMAAQPGGCFLVCEDGDDIVGYVLMAGFPGMDEMAELWVAASHAGQGVSRGLLERCWPDSPTPELGRLVIAVGTPADLTLFTDFGVMPVSGHWHMRHRVDRYLEHRAQEVDSTEPGVHVLTPERAAEEWKRLEPEAIGHERPALHEFFGRDRSCLATVDQKGRPSALCWVSSDGDIGPAVGEKPANVIPVVLAAFDRIAKTQEPPLLGIYASTTAWHLLHRLRMLGFRVFWPSWIMCSVPLPGLDRYVPTRPPFVL